MMFKEQLHESFDRISPSPELLDRISAMMSEEAGKKKPPIRMSIARYGGIAAGLVLAAGVTIAAVNMSGNSASTIRPEAAAPAAAREEKAESYMQTTANAEYEPVYEADADGEEYFAAEADTKNIDISTLLPDTTTAAFHYIAPEPLETSAATTAAAITTETTTTPAIDHKAINAGAEDNDDAYKEESGEMTGAEENLIIGVTPDGEMPACEEDCSIVGPDIPALSSEFDPATGVSVPLSFEMPFVQEFLTIPEGLLNAVDGIIVNGEDGYAMGEKWHEYTRSVYGTGLSDGGEDAVPQPEREGGAPGEYDLTSHFGTLTDIDGEIDLYTFIRYFDIPEDTVRTALNGIISDERIELLISGSPEDITEAFASPCSIVKGDRIYSPNWLWAHPYSDYTQAGITSADAAGVFEKISEMPLVSEEIKTFLLDKLDRFIEGER